MMISSFNRYTLVRYEDLAKDVIGVARQLFEFAGVPFDDQVFYISF